MDWQNSSNRRKFLKGIGAGVVGTAIAGCVGNGGGGSSAGGSSGNGSSGGSDGGSSGGLTKVNVVVPHYGLWDTSIPVIVGKEKGFFKDEGISVSRVDVSGGGSNVRTVSSGSADIGLATGLPAIFAAYKGGSNITIVANEDNNLGDITYYSKKGSGYKNLKDCTDAKIAFSEPGSSSNIVALRAIKSAGLSGAKAVSAGGPPDAHSALVGGEVDLGWTVPPFFFDAIRNGNMQIVFRAKDINPFDSMTARAHFASGNAIEKNPNKIKSYFAAHKKALDWAYNNLKKATKMWGNATNNDSDTVKLMLNEVPRAYPRDALKLDGLTGLDNANQLAIDFDFIDSKLSQKELNKLIDTSPLPSTDNDTFS